MDLPESLRTRLSFLLGKLYLTSLDIEGTELGQLGVDVKQQAVLTLLAEEGPITQQELGQRIGIDRTTIVTVVDGLEQGGFVERRRSPKDRRAYQLTLTASGSKAQRQGQQLVERAERAALGALTAEERHLLKQLLAKAVT